MQAKKQGLQNLNKSSVDNLKNVRCEASRHFRKDKRNIRKLELMYLKLTVRPRILEP